MEMLFSKTYRMAALLSVAYFVVACDISKTGGSGQSANSLVNTSVNAAATTTPGPDVAYILDDVANSIYTYIIDKSGKLTPSSTKVQPTGNTPTDMVVDQDDGYVYVSNYKGSPGNDRGNISIYKISQKDNSLSIIGSVTSNHPHSLAIDHITNHAYVADYDDGLINVYKIESTGILTQLPGDKGSIKTLQSPVTVSVQGEFLYVAHNISTANNSNIDVFLINDDGSLSSYSNTMAVASPYILTPLPNNEVMFIAGVKGNTPNTKNNLSSFSTTDGELSRIESYNISGDISSVKISQDNHYMFVGDVINNVVKQYAVLGNGSLNPLGTMNLNADPVDMDFSQDRKRLYIITNNTTGSTKKVPHFVTYVGYDENVAIHPAKRINDQLIPLMESGIHSVAKIAVRKAPTIYGGRAVYHYTNVNSPEIVQEFPADVDPSTIIPGKTVKMYLVKKPKSSSSKNVEGVYTPLLFTVALVEPLVVITAAGVVIPTVLVYFYIQSQLQPGDTIFMEDQGIKDKIGRFIERYSQFAQVSTIGDPSFLQRRLPAGSKDVAVDTSIILKVFLPLEQGVLPLDPSSVTPDTVKVTQTVEGKSEPVDVNIKVNSLEIIMKPKTSLKNNATVNIQVNAKAINGINIYDYNGSFTTKAASAVLVYPEESNFVLPIENAKFVVYYPNGVSTELQNNDLLRVTYHDSDEVIPVELVSKDYELPDEDHRNLLASGQEMLTAPNNVFRYFTFRSKTQARINSLLDAAARNLNAAGGVYERVGTFQTTNPRHLYIFVSKNYKPDGYYGNMQNTQVSNSTLLTTSIAAADQICRNSSRNLRIQKREGERGLEYNSTFKALVASNIGGDQRYGCSLIGAEVSCGQEYSRDWPLVANGQYFNVDAEFVSETNGGSIFDPNALFNNPIDYSKNPGESLVWTGMDNNWLPVSDNCNDWTAHNWGTFSSGAYGNSNSKLLINVLNSGIFSCSTRKSIICVQSEVGSFE